MYLLWSHGLDGVPWGGKSMALAETAREMGLTLEAFDYRPENDPDKRVEMLLEHLRGMPEPIVLAGSSLGGYVSAAVSLHIPVKALFLCAPAFYIPGFGKEDFSGFNTPAVIVHGWRDSVVPVENAWRFAKAHRADLHVLDAEHRLAEATEPLAFLFKGFLHQHATA